MRLGWVLRVSLGVAGGLSGCDSKATSSSASDAGSDVASDIGVVADTPSAPAADTVPAASTWGPEHCPAGATGFGIGDVLGAVTVKTCEGEDFALEQLCGAGGLWIFAAHAWCPNCQLTAGFAEEVHAGFAEHELASVNVVVEGATALPPTAQDCVQWRDTFGLEDVVTLYDPSGSLSVLREQNLTALSVFVTGERRINAKLHTDDRPTIEGQIRAALDL